MELLHEWLGPTVEQELGEVLEWRGKSEVNRSQLTGQIGDLTFDDDGSNLRIRSAKKQVVQLIKFVPNHEPLQACLSDSVNRVYATISMDAVQRYTQKTGKRLTDGTLGGFIQLIRFEIVATHIGSRQKRITLFVTELKALGANGSGGYGMPRPTEDETKIKELIQKLIQFRAQESARRPTPSRQQYPKNTLPSRLDSIASQESSPSDTQTMFATQAPLPKMTALCSPQPKAFSSGSVVDPRNPLLTRPQAHAKPSLNATKRPVTEGEALLGLLQRSKKQSSNTNVTSEEPTRFHLANGLTTHSETGTFAIQKASMRPPRFPGRKIIDLSGQPSVSASIPAAVEDTLGKDAAEATTPVDTPGRSKSAAMTSFRTRISSRDVNISKDQEKLLNSVDSWLPAEPGRRGPVANLPISILHNLNQKADLRAPRRGTFLKERKHPRSSEELQENHRPSSFDDDNSSPAETDSDAPVPDSEWPPSPARDQLPPDSSAENTDVQSNPSAHIRRLSNASVSSRLIQSRRPTPLRIMRSSRNSAERSPLVMSPSIVSNPAGQGVHQRSRTGTPKSTASRTLTPVSIGGTSAISHNMEQNAFNGHHEGVDRDESVEAVRAALEDTVPAIMSQRSPRISEIVGGLKPHHDNHLRRSPKVIIKQPSLYIDLSQEQVSSPHRASTSLETSSLQSSRAHSTTENFGGGHRHDIPSGVYSIPPSPESDLEMAAPFSLNDKATLLRNFSHPPFPSTASQPIEPFTQVKRTPYVNGQIRNHSPPRPEREFPISKSNASHLVANGILLEDVDHVTQSTPPILEVSSSEGFVDNIKENSGSKDIDRYSATVTAVADEQNHTVQASGKSESHNPEELNGGLVKTNKPDVVEKPAASSGGGQGIFEVNAEGDLENLAGHIDHETKRKASDLDFLSTNVAKRRKKFKISRAFPVTENIENQPDPLDTARRYRQDFISSRKGSEAGKPQESLSTPIAVSKVEPPESRDLRTNPEAQVALEDVTETGRQTLLYHKAQVPGLQDDQTMDIGLVLPKQSRGDESVQVGPLAPSNAEPMARSKSNGSIQGTKVSETEAHSKSPPLDDLQEVTPDQTMEEVYTALDNVSARKNYIRKSSKSVSKSNDEDRLEDALTGATPNAITDHTLGDGDAQKATSIDQTLDLGAKVAGPESQHDHFMVTDVDDATPGAQSDDVMVLESEIAKIDGLAVQAMDVGAEAAGSSVQSAQTVASDAIRLPENDVSMDVDSGSTTPYPKSDHSADVEAHGAILGVQHGEYMDVQPDELNDDTDSADTAKLTKDELGAHMNGESLNISVNQPSSYEPEIQSTIGRQEIPLQDHPKSISEFPNAPQTLIPEADTTQPNGQCVTPVKVATDPLTSNLQEGQESEAPAIAMSVRPGEYSVSNQPECSAVVLAPVSNGDAKPQFATSRPAEQSALSEVPQPSGNVKTANPIVVSAAEHKEPKIHTAPSSIFDRFRAAYPAYAGDLKHFVAVCRKIKTLVDLDRMQHQYLWDDFIIRHKIEYAQHLRQCAEDAEDALPYEDFYKTEIPKPLYCNEVVTHRKLDEALSLLHIESNTPRKRSVNVIETPVKPMRHARAIYEKPLAPEKYSTRVQKRSKRRETIDLTLDDQEDDSIKSSEDLSMTPPIYSIPKARRSLPWLETNTHLEKTSPQTSKPSPGGLVDLGARLRALKEPSVTSTGLDRKAHALNEPSNTPMKPNRNVGRKPDATTDGKSIRETWGVGAHDVLEPRYYDKISPRHLQLMKDIANMVDLEEARRLIYKKIHSRTGLHLAASKAVTVADLEAVFDFLSTKKVKKFKSRVKDDSTRTMVDPRGARQPRASRREREDERPGEWWKDDNTPFKSFAKAYKSIKPGNGNSFATGQTVKMEAGVSRAGTRDKKMTGKKIDPLRWEL